MNFTGIWIPADVAMHAGLSDKAKMTYGLISSLDNEDGCYASNGFMARTLSVDERHVRRLIDELIAAGLVLRVLDESGRTLRTIEKAALEVAIHDSKDSAHGHSRPGGEDKNVRGGRTKMSSNSKEDRKGDRDTKKLDPLPFNTPAFIAAWNKWVDYRRDIKKPMHWKTMNSMFVDMKRWGESATIEAIETSIKKGWIGLFATAATRPLTPDDHAQPW